MNKQFVRDAERLVMELLAISGVSGEEEAIMERIAVLLGEAGAPAGTIKFDRANRRSPRGGAR